MDKWELYAVGHYLSEWPEDASYNEVLGLLNGESYDEISTWDVIDAVPFEDVVFLIENMVEHLRITFK